MYRPVFFNLPDIIYFNFYLSPVGSCLTCYGTFFTLEREYLASLLNCSIEICLKCSFQNWPCLMRLGCSMEITNSCLPIRISVYWVILGITSLGYFTRPKVDNYNWTGNFQYHLIGSSTTFDRSYLEEIQGILTWIQHSETLAHYPPITFKPIHLWIIDWRVHSRFNEITTSLLVSFIILEGVLCQK